jgi:HEAT repeat protein
MDDRDIRNCISDVAKQLGLKIHSLQRNPLTNVWHIDIIEHNEQIRFKPTAAATVEECAQQFRKLLGFHEPVLEEEIDNLRLHTPDNITAAMQRLVAIGDAAIEPLIDALLNQCESCIFRSRVADTLAMIGSPRAIRPLIQTLSDSDVGVRWHAVRALAEIGDESAIGPLERLVAGETGRVSITTTLHVSVRDDAQKAISQILAKKK